MRDVKGTAMHQLLMQLQQPLFTFIQSAIVRGVKRKSITDMKTGTDVGITLDALF